MGGKVEDKIPNTKTLEESPDCTGGLKTLLCWVKLWYEQIRVTSMVLDLGTSPVQTPL